MTRVPQEFNLEHQYQLYLSRCKLVEAEMPEDQRRETKRTFFGACGQMLVLLRDDITKLEDDDGAEMLQNMLNQVAAFWLNESKRQS